MVPVKTILFSILTIFLTAFLYFYPLDELKVAQFRVEPLVRNETHLKEKIFSSCETLLSKNNTEIEKRFLDFFPIHENIENGLDCSLSVQHTNQSIFFFSRLWAFSLRVEEESKTKLLVNETFHLETLRPIVFLPVLVFLLTVIFGFHSYGIFWVFPLYLFFLGGGSLISTVDRCAKSLSTLIHSDTSMIGLCFIFLWLTIQRHRSEKKQERKKALIIDRTLNRISTSILGLWNPLLFTGLAPFLYPMKKKVLFLISFFDLQVLLLSISLYGLYFEWGDMRGFISNTLRLPRYFTFSTVLILCMGYVFKKPKNHPMKPLFKMPHFGRAFLAVILFECAHFYFGLGDQLHTLTRVGIALLSSEFFQPTQLLNTAKIVKGFIPVGSWIVLSSFLPIYSLESGVVETLLVLLNPRIHPSAYALFSFLAAFGLTFLTGSVGVAFFALYAFLSSQDFGLIRAAILDGILAGILFSPFSLYNLIPVAQFGLDLKETLKLRIQRLGVPFILGIFIYLLGTVSSVSILQPVTFVFCCMTLIALKLRNKSWNLSTINPQA